MFYRLDYRLDFISFNLQRIKILFYLKHLLAKQCAFRDILHILLMAVKNVIKLKYILNFQNIQIEKLF